MYFSVIVPTYNPREYLPELLNSITRNACVDEIEVIIADDCSEEDFTDILDSFPSLTIRDVRNEVHQGFPRLGRQTGATIATGKWICFADQDDYFVDGAFDKIKQYIEEKDIHDYLTSHFIMHPEGTEDYLLYDGTKGWTHGKFYEKSFWDFHDLGYDDVQYCEDINLSTKTACIMIAENISMHLYEEPIYVWDKKKDSLSEQNYLSKSMPDYIRGTFGVIADHIWKCRFNSNILEQLSIKFIQTLYHTFFYFQSPQLRDEKETLLKTMLILTPLYERFKEVTGFTTEIILEKTETELIGLYAETRYEDFKQIPFIEQTTFADWMRAYLK